MIVVGNDQIGRRAKGQNVSPADPAPRLILEWTSQVKNLSRTHRA
jgi:hypothetical protein